VERLRSVQQALGLSGFIIEPNVGSGIPPERVARSLHLFAHAVAPQLREAAGL
jgi:hypothetical protein